MKNTLKSVILISSVSLMVACSGYGPNQGIGTVAGGIAGGLLGSTIGGGAGRAVAIGAGAIGGSLIGGAIGRQMDYRYYPNDSGY